MFAHSRLRFCVCAFAFAHSCLRIRFSAFTFAHSHLRIHVYALRLRFRIRYFPFTRLPIGASAFLLLSTTTILISNRFLRPFLPFRSLDEGADMLFFSSRYGSKLNQTSPLSFCHTSCRYFLSNLCFALSTLMPDEAPPPILSMASFPLAHR